ncbi:uncharacterized protein LOC134200250 [Bombyx mori]|uniref:uncharacterized protein LOC134198843 n=1 Tax=Bombyx mori TaxID=7091 RepID=UPI002ED3DE5E
MHELTAHLVPCSYWAPQTSTTQTRHPPRDTSSKVLAQLQPLPHHSNRNTHCFTAEIGMVMVPVRSMALYGAPVWCHVLTHEKVAALRRRQRAIVVRVIQGYLTVSYEVARPSASVAGARGLQSRQSVLEAWSRRLADPSAGLRTVEAICLVLADWVGRDRGRLTSGYLCRLTRLFTTTQTFYHSKSYQPPRKLQFCGFHLSYTMLLPHCGSQPQTLVKHAQARTSPKKLASASGTRTPPHRQTRTHRTSYLTGHDDFRCVNFSSPRKLACFLVCLLVVKSATMSYAPSSRRSSRYISTVAHQTRGSASVCSR